MGATRGQFVGEVIANVSLCREHFKLILRLPQFPPTQPGQFVQVAGRELDFGTDSIVESEWSNDHSPKLVGDELRHPVPVLRRPFSLAGRRDLSDGVEIDLIYRVVGIATDWFSRLSRGDNVHVLGPLGNIFTLPPANSTALLIGGGVGIPPMIYLATALAGRKAVVFSGAQTRDLLPLTITDDATPPPDSARPLHNIGEFARHGIGAVIATDDGSYGYRGFVTQALEKYLDQQQKDAPAPTAYTCGPEPMMKRVAEICKARGIVCQIAVERAMACGMGTCQSCVIKVKKPDPSQPPLRGSDWCFRLACTDGPVFLDDQLLW